MEMYKILLMLSLTYDITATKVTSREVMSTNLIITIFFYHVLCETLLTVQE